MSETQAIGGQGRALRPKLSTLVVAHNEERHLSACLETLSFAEEIVVVLDRCTDGSKKIVESFGAIIVEGAWPLEGARRNAGIKRCTGDWILEVDADERIPNTLAREIRTAIADTNAGYFQIRFDNYVGETLVRHGWGAYNGASSGPRLFAKGAKIWGEQHVHPKLALKGERQWLETPIVHHVDDSVSDMIHRLDRYTTAHAQDLRASGKTGTLHSNIRRIFTRSWKSYVRRKGYREGSYGVLLALFAGLYPILSYLKARIDLENQETADK